MHNIKYKPLKNNDDDNYINHNDLSDKQQLHYHQNHNENSSFQKLPWFLKFLFMCFVTIQLIYVVNNYDFIINWFKTNQSNQTESVENFKQFQWKETTTQDIITDYEEYQILNTTGLSVETIIVNENDLITIFNEETTTGQYNNDDDDDGDKTKQNMLITDHENHLTTIVPIQSTSNDLNKQIITKKPKTLVSNHDTTTMTTTVPYYNRTSTITSKLQTTNNSSLLETTKKMRPPINSPPVLTTPPLITPTTITPSVIKQKQQKYFINTSKCHIPYVDPLTSDVRKIFKPQHSTGCTKDKAIVSVTYDDVEAHYILDINYEVAKHLRKKDSKTTIEDDVVCCYQEVIRSGSDKNVDSSFKLLPCTNFHQNFTVPHHIHGIITTCKSKFTKSTLQKDAFSFIQVNKTIVQENSSSSIRRKPSVLMIGIDSLSRMNFRRNMPEMYKYLVENKWHELMGYNKVGDNTLPNLMPLFAGYTRETVYKKCHPKNVGGFDSCNFMWTKFKEHGYYTAYAEDTTIITTFNYHLSGFKKPPTDYYFHPISLAIEKSLKKQNKAGLPYCVGRRQNGEYIYDYGLEFAKRYQNLSSFGFFWTNSFSHNSFDVAATMDKTMLKYFKELKSSGILENSIVIFFSDHGIRWGPLLKLTSSFLEERLPMFFISIPKWLQQQYPDLMKNLEINQKRLISPFDIHVTLQHLLKLGEPSYNITPAYDCATGKTIFQEIPENRTCNDACIPETWCTCLPFKTESTKNKTVQMITNLIVQEMNQYFVNKNLTSLCSTLKLNEITMAKQHNRQDKQKSSENIFTYVIDFITDPKTEPKTLFSATVDYNVKTHQIHLNVEDISRRSKYENTAKCTDDKEAKKYCICKNSLQSP